MEEGSNLQTVHHPLSRRSTAHRYPRYFFGVVSPNYFSWLILVTLPLWVTSKEFVETERKRVIQLKQIHIENDMLCFFNTLFSLLFLKAFCLQNQASPGYNASEFYPHSSYLHDFVTTARQQGLLYGESFLPTAVYMPGVDMFDTTIQQVSPSFLDGTKSTSRYSIFNTLRI